MSQTIRLPTYYIPHGGGPCFFIKEPFLGPAGTWDKMAEHLRSLSQSTLTTPRALLVISAHWETEPLQVTAQPQPSLLYDYYGFPDYTYELKYPAAGDPALARRVCDLLNAKGLRCEEERERGFDHGVFVPFLLIYPKADIPIVQLSLQAGLNPAAHLAIGRALAPLRDEGVLIVGSGMSYHNLRSFTSPRGDVPSQRFDAWLSATVENADAQARERALLGWENAPEARAVHPREEHLIPLLVAAGAAGTDRGIKTYGDTIAGKAISSFRFGGALS